MEHIQFSRTMKYRPGEYAAEAVRLLLAAELLLQATLQILSSQRALWRPDELSCLVLQMTPVFTVLLFGVLVPLCGKFRAFACMGAALALTALLVWYGFQRSDRIRAGLAGLLGDYLLAWNAYYRTNYVIESEPDEISFAFGFLMLAILLLFLLLYHVTGLRLLMLLPPLAALTPGLLVDLLPDWKGLAFFFVGTLVLYSGKGAQRKVIFAPVQNRKQRNLSVRASLLSIALTAAAGTAIVFASSTLFAKPAAGIPEKMPEFMAFQRKLEDRMLSLTDGVHIPSKRQRLDNATPQYTNETVLTITADQLPLTNLYLPEFYSGSYRGGIWTQENEDYRRAAKQIGVDGDHLGTLLRQMGYEYFTSMPYLAVNADETMLRNYTIRYGKRRTTSAWTPYLTDLTSLQEDIWVEDEGLVKKKWKTDELSFAGWACNVDLYTHTGYFYLARTDQEKNAVDWYSEYAVDHYSKSSDIAAVKQLAREWFDESYLPHESVALDRTFYRLSMARFVSLLLDELADYNLYLDDIPEKTDTVQYFLETGHEGYCMHFASAGTLLLQELGIPARYASGYIVKRNSFTANQDRGYSATVYDRNAHAWTEVYLDNIGWVPVEMTPGYETPANALPTDENRQEELKQQHKQKQQQEASGKTPNRKQPLTTENASTENDTHKETEKQTAGTGTGTGEDSPDAGKHSAGAGTAVSWKKAAAGVGIAVFACTLALLIWHLIDSGMRRYQEALQAEIRNRQNRRAVQRMNRRIYRRLHRGGVIPVGRFRPAAGGSKAAGVRWLSITDAEYEKRLIRAYPSVTPGEWADFLRIAKKAAFSAEAVETPEMEFCYRIYRTHRKRR